MTEQRTSCEVYPLGSRYNQTNERNLTTVSEGPPTWEAFVAEFARRYSNPSTRRYYERDRTALFDYADVDIPQALTESMVLAWCGLGRASVSTSAGSAPLLRTHQRRKVHTRDNRLRTMLSELGPHAERVAEAHIL